MRIAKNENEMNVRENLQRLALIPRKGKEKLRCIDDNSELYKISKDVNLPAHSPASNAMPAMRARSM